MDLILAAQPAGNLHRVERPRTDQDRSQDAAPEDSMRVVPLVSFVAAPMLTGLER